MSDNSMSSTCRFDPCPALLPEVDGRPVPILDDIQRGLSIVESPVLPTRTTYCPCGRPARQVLDGGDLGPTGYCGNAQHSLNACGCNKGDRHDRSVCYVYGRGLAFDRWVVHAVVRHGAGDELADTVNFDDNGQITLSRPTWCTTEQWPRYRAAFSDFLAAVVDALRNAEGIR